MVVDRKRSSSESDVHQMTKKPRPSTHLDIITSTQSPYLSSTHVEDTPGALPADAAYSVTWKASRSPQNDPAFREWPQLPAKPLLGPLRSTEPGAHSFSSDNRALSSEARTSLLLDRSTTRKLPQPPSTKGLHAARQSKRGASLGELDVSPLTKSSSTPVLHGRDTSEEKLHAPLAQASDTPIESIEGTEIEKLDGYPVVEKPKPSSLSKSSLRKLQRLLSIQVPDRWEDFTGGAFTEWASIMAPAATQEPKPPRNKASCRGNSTDSLSHEKAIAGTEEASETNESKKNDTSTDLTSSILYSRGVYQFDDQQPYAEPKNLEAILQVVTRKRDSPPPSTDQATAFKYGLRHALNEDSVKEQAVHIIPTVELYASKSDFFKLAGKMQWKDGVALCPLITPRLSPPEPDYCVSIDRLKFPNLAIENMKYYVTPADGTMAFPIFNIEVKGPDGKANGAMFQNMQSCSVAVNNILELKKRLGRAAGFYNIAHVVSGILTERVFELHVHWVELKDSQDVFYNREIGVWALRKLDDVEYIGARRAIRDVLDWQKGGIGQDLVKDMKDLNTQILMPPPQTPSTAS
ncbi:hypothetical protein MMC30_002988 [Trapelia coarctata]|nr:hypothetical protein [Trapelia coarctata]